MVKANSVPVPSPQNVLGVIELLFNPLAGFFKAVMQ